MNYAEYMRSGAWRRRRARFAKLRRPECRCGRTEDLELHHLTYERLGDERDDDLTWLCVDCHRALHELFRAGAATLDPATMFKPREPVVAEDDSARRDLEHCLRVYVEALRTGAEPMRLKRLRQVARAHARKCGVLSEPIRYEGVDDRPREDRETVDAAVAAALAR